MVHCTTVRKYLIAQGENESDMEEELRLIDKVDLDLDYSLKDLIAI